MANEEHLAKLREGVAAWNAWRRSDPVSLRPDLSGADLTEMRMPLQEVNFRNADLSDANLSSNRPSHVFWETLPVFISGVNLYNADFTGANLTGANLRGSILSQAKFLTANLSTANLSCADCPWADFTGASLEGANLKNANLVYATLVQANLTGADLDGSRVYGAAVWDVITDEQTSQHDLLITPHNTDSVAVDDLEVAQFVYLLLENRRVRKVIDSITSKVVLILGRFTEERKKVLDALRDELRRRNYTPVVFDFGKPDSRDLTETVSTLAHMARFVIADITDAKSIANELREIVPNLPSLPVRPIILEGQYEYAMFKDFGGYLSVLPPWRYQDSDHLLASLETEVIGPALSKAEEIEERRKAFEQELVKR